MESRPKMDTHYLIAEDDESTQLLIKRAFKKLELPAPLNFVWDGTEAIEYLSGAGRYQDRSQFPLPCLMLLDQRMPRASGLEVLSWMRQPERPREVRDMVVVMFTASEIESEVLEAYDRGVNSFVRKPVAFAEFTQIIASIHHYWFGCNYFPDPRKGVAGGKTSPFVVGRDVVPAGT